MRCPLLGPSALRRRISLFDGGVGLRTVTEFWSGALGIGPKLDVGVGPPGKFAVVVAEGARFGVGGTSSSSIMAFDLQAGVAYSAPFKLCDRLGVAMMVGMERLAAGGVDANSGSTWQWSATGTLGLRASIGIGPLSLWTSADATLRSSRFEVGGPASVAVPRLAATLSIGCFLTAFEKVFSTSSSPRAPNAY